MPIVLESISTQALAAGTSTTITKPSGLTVGDTMLACVGSVFPITGSQVFTVPSGWTSLFNDNYSVGTTNFTYAVFTKTADSADVAASNFTFTHPTRGQFVGGALARISDYGIVDDSAFVSSTGTSPVTIASTITPTFSNSLNFIFALAGDNTSAGGTVSFSNPSLTTDNPSWTEHLDSAISSGNARYGIAIYSATRSQSTAWGNVTLTYAQNTNADIGAVLINIAPRIDGSHSVTTAPIYVVNQPFLRTGALDIASTDPDVSSRELTQWNNPTKESTTWNNDTL